MVELEGTGQVELGSASGETYLYGSLYADGKPLEGQLAFQLSYDWLNLAAGLLLEAAGWLAMLLPAAFLLVLPGWALLAAWYPDWITAGWPEKLALAVGVSLPLYPILLLWARLVGIYPGAAWAWGPAMIAGGYLLWRAWRGRHAKRNLPLTNMRFMRRSTNFWPNLVFSLALLVIFGVRFWVIRRIDVPLWGDSYQHTMIAQRMLETGGLFNSWQPYTPYESLTVQFGFPVLVALWSWLTGEGVLRSTLVTGQITNGLAVLALYPLALRLSRGNRWAGNFSLMVAGLLMLIPAFYVNWGRYAQLSGQVVLPVSLALLISVTLRRGRVGIGEIFLNAMVLAGMLLHYYRMAFYTIAFLPVLLVLTLPLLKERPKRLLALFAAAGLALVLLLPWVQNVMGSSLSGKLESGMGNAIPTELVLTDFSAWLKVRSLISLWLLVAAGIALLASLAMRRWAISSLVLWVSLLAAVPLGMLVGMPGSNAMQSFAVTIFLYIPISIALGWFGGEVICAGLQRWPRAAMPGLVLAVLLALLLGARMQKEIANPTVYAIATRPDLRAMQWIQSNTSSQAVFLVEGFRIYGGSTAVGSDGGWWIPLLTGRQNTMPPQYALINERPARADYTQRVVDLVKTLETHPVLESTSLALLCEWHVGYIYIGQRQGLASFEQLQLFAPEQLESLPLKYAQDRVRIYELPADRCRE